MSATFLLGTMDVESIPADLRPGDWGRGILELFPNDYPILALTQALKKRRKATDSKYTAFEEDLPPLRVVINDADNVTAGDDEVVVDDGNGTGMARAVRKNMVLRYGTNPGSGELVRVTADPENATTVPIERGWAGTTAATMANNGYLTVVQDAHADGEPSPSSLYQEPSEIYNYMEIFQHSWSVTRRRGWVATRHGVNPETRGKRLAYLQHAQARESAFLFGERYKTTAADVNGAERTTTGGVCYFLNAANVHDGSSTAFTYAHWNAWVRPLVQYGNPRERVCLCGDVFYGCVHDMVADNTALNMAVNEMPNKWGFRLSRVRTSGPDVILLQHPLLTRYWPGEGIFLDLTQLGLVYEADFEVQKVVQDNNPNVSKSQYYSDCGLEFGNALAHGRIYGVTAYTAAA